MVPSPLTAMYEESWSGVSGGLAAIAIASSAACASVAGAPIETTSAPPALRIARREKIADLSCLVMALSSTHHRGRALDGAQDGHVCTAAALQPGQCVADLGVGRLLLVAQERRRRHDPAIDAITALRHFFLDISGLQRVRLVRRAEAGERDDLAVADRRDRRDAGADRLAVEMHGAGAALGKPAAEMRIVQAEIVTQRVEQRHVVVRLYGAHLSIDVEGIFLGHCPASSICATAVFIGAGHVPV